MKNTNDDVYIEYKDLKTFFKYSNEAQNYIEILGGERLNKPGKYRLDGLEFRPTNVTINGKEYYGIRCNQLPSILYRYFEDYGLNGSYTYNGAILGLEPLALTHAIMMGYNKTYSNESLIECYNRVLNDAKKEMLEKVVKDRPNNIPFELIPFDNAIAVFLNEDFDIEGFLDKCVFNTTGYYDNYNAIDFSWYTKDEPEVVYSIDFYRNHNGYNSSITYGEKEDRFYQEAYHMNHRYGETLMYTHNPEVCLSLNLKENKISEAMGDTVTFSKKATENDMHKMRAIFNSFIDKDLSFDKVKSLKREYPRNNLRR